MEPARGAKTAVCLGAREREARVCERERRGARAAAGGRGGGAATEGGGGKGGLMVIVHELKCSDLMFYQRGVE